MRSLLILWLAGGCGRLGFDAETTDDARGDDQSMDAAACTQAGNDDDGDGIADPCDPCPYLPGGGTDADGDGIGDACDPSAAAERFVFFDPFVGTSFDPRWTSNGSVVIGGSVARMDAVGGLAALGYETQPAITEVALRGTLLALGGGTQQFSVQFGDTAIPDAEYCEVYGTPGTELKLTRQVGPAFSLIGKTSITPLAPGPFVLRLRHSAAGFWCELTTGGQVYTAQGAGTFAQPRNYTYMQFSEMNVAIDSFVEVEPAP